MNYVLYFPGKSGCSNEILVDAGLGDLLQEDDSGPEFAHVDRGPDNGSGVICTWRKGVEFDAPLAITPNQRWTKCYEKLQHPEFGELTDNRFWLGVVDDDPPQPSEMMRRNPIPGDDHMMADGFSYLLPTITKMPAKFGIDENGNVCREVKEKYKTFYDDGMKLVVQLLDLFEKSEKLRAIGKVKDIDDYLMPVEVKDGMHLLTAAINLNYRLSWELCFMLGIFDDSSAARAFLTFCELSEIKHVVDDQKKTLEPVSIRVGSIISSTEEV